MVTCRDEKEIKKKNKERIGKYDELNFRHVDLKLSLAYIGGDVLYMTAGITDPQLTKKEI